MISPTSSSSTSGSLSPAEVGNAVATAVMRKTLDAARQQGAAAVQLIDAAGQGQSGSDPLTAQATGLGNLIDITA